MQETITKDVDGTKYQFYFLKPSRALVILTRLTKLGLPSLGAAMPKEGGIKEVLDASMASLNLDTAARLLAEKLDESLVLETIQEVLGTVEKDRVRVDMEQEFEGKPLKLLKVVKQALEVNYGDFFGGLKGLRK